MVSRVADRVLGRPLWLAAIAASAGAGLVHLAHGPAHLEELGALGLGFYVAAALQLGWAAAVLAALAGSRSGWSRRRAAALAASGIAINGAILAAWAMSRVVGLPAGAMPWTPQAIGPADGISTILEGLLVVGLTAARRGWALPRLPRVRALSTGGAAIAILLIITGTAVAIGPSEAGHTHQPGSEHAVTDERAAADEHAVGDHAESDHDGGTAGN